MLKTLFFALIALLVSCGEKGAKGEKAGKPDDSYGALIEKARETEALLQKRADSVARLPDSLGVPR